MGTLVAFLLSAARVAAILDTRYLQGIGITVLYVIFSSSSMVVMSLIFGVSLIGLMAGV